MCQVDHPQWAWRKKKQHNVESFKVNAGCNFCLRDVQVPGLVKQGNAIRKLQNDCKTFEPFIAYRQNT